MGEKGQTWLHKQQPGSTAHGVIGPPQQPAFPPPGWGGAWGGAAQPSWGGAATQAAGHAAGHAGQAFPPAWAGQEGFGTGNLAGLGITVPPLLQFKDHSDISVQSGNRMAMPSAMMQMGYMISQIQTESAGQIAHMQRQLDLLHAPGEPDRCTAALGVSFVYTTYNHAHTHTHTSGAPVTRGAPVTKGAPLT